MSAGSAASGRSGQPVSRTRRPAPAGHAAAERLEGRRLLSVAPSPYQSITASPVAEAYVRDGAYSRTNFGAPPQLLVKNAAPGGGYVRDAYVKYNVDLSSIGSVTQAFLSLHGGLTSNTAESSVGVGIYPVSPNWNQNTITFANAPAVPAKPLATGKIQGSAGYSIDLTGYLQKEQAAGVKTVSFAIEGLARTNATVAFSSATLVVGTQTLKTPTPTPAPTPLPKPTPTPARSPTPTPAPTGFITRVERGTEQGTVDGVQATSPVLFVVTGVSKSGTAANSTTRITFDYTDNYGTYHYSGPETLTALGSTVIHDGANTFTFGLYVPISDGGGETATSGSFSGTNNGHAENVSFNIGTAANNPYAYGPSPWATQTLPPAAATYVRDGPYSSQNFGPAAALQVRGAAGGVGSVRVSYLKFDVDLANLPRVESAGLLLQGSEASGTAEPFIQVGAYPVSSNWGQNTITYANAPAPGSAPLATNDVVYSPTPLPYLFDLTSYLRQQQLAGATSVSVAIEGTTFTTDSVAFVGGNSPKLVLSVDNPASPYPTPTPTPTSSPSVVSVAPTPAPLTPAEQVQADQAGLASDRQAARQTAAADNAALRTAVSAGKAVVVADRAKIKADRRSPDSLRADRARLAADRLQLRTNTAAAKVKVRQDELDYAARIKADKLRLRADKHRLRGA